MPLNTQSIRNRSRDMRMRTSPLNLVMNLRKMIWKMIFSLEILINKIFTTVYMRGTQTSYPFRQPE